MLIADDAEEQANAQVVVVAAGHNVQCIAPPNTA
jgi:hypothetical protein